MVSAEYGSTNFLAFSDFGNEVWQADNILLKQRFTLLKAGLTGSGSRTGGAPASRRRQREYRASPAKAETAGPPLFAPSSPNARDWRC
jgi:hypothetical protein